MERGDWWSSSANHDPYRHSRPHIPIESPSIFHIKMPFRTHSVLFLSVALVPLVLLPHQTRGLLRGKGMRTVQALQGVLLCGRGCDTTLGSRRTINIQPVPDERPAIERLFTKLTLNCYIQTTMSCHHFLIYRMKSVI